MDFVNHAIIASPDSPDIAALQFFTSAGRGLVSKASNLAKIRLDVSSGKRFNCF